MNINNQKVLIAYPPDWGCFTKFSRKLENLLSSFTRFSVLFLDDNQGMIDRLFLSDLRVESIGYWDSEKECPTHAVIFDDGESFSQLKKKLSIKNIDSRLIKITVTRVINIEKGERYDLYIGRGSGFGNPYAIGLDGDDREEVIRKFKYDFDRDYLKDNFKTRLLSHQGKTLGCHCKPMACHGDVLAEFLNSYDDGL